MSTEDYYKILGVSRTASDDEIRSAYRKLAKKHHPDRNRGKKTSEDEFKRVQEAYDVLSDKQKREQYDAFGQAGVGKVVDQGGAKQYQWGGGSNINVDDLEDLFNAFGGAQGGNSGRASVFDQIFTGRSGRPTSRARRPVARTKGQDVERPITLSFEQAVEGATVQVDLVQHSPSGQNRQTLEIKIPPNVSDGQRIRLRGKGGSGAGGGPPGDLFIVCHVKPHPFYRREGRNIYLDVPITVTEAMLGTKIEVPTLHGIMTVSIPPGTSSGAKLRLRGKGIASEPKKNPGDQYITISITVPKKLTEKQEKLVRELSETIEENPRTKIGWN
jgi:curved DNA-binding protein